MLKPMREYIENTEDPRRGNAGLLIPNKSTPWIPAFVGMTLLIEVPRKG